MHKHSQTQVMISAGKKTNTVRLTALQRTLKSTVELPNQCKAVEPGVQVRHACSCCAITENCFVCRRKDGRSLPGGQIGFIQNILMRRLVVIHKVAVGHVCQVLTVAVLAVLWRYHTICDEIRQEWCACSITRPYLSRFEDR